MKVIKYLQLILLLTTAVAIIILLSLRAELLEDLTVKILLPLCTVLGLLLGRTLDIFNNQKETRKRDEIRKE